MAKRKRRKQLSADPVTVQIDDLAHDGRGVAHVDGKTVFLHGALPGETVTFQYSIQRRSHDEGVVQSIDVASEQRVEPRCAHFGVCGGCALQHMDPVAQIQQKATRLFENMRRIGRVEPECEFPPIQCEPWGYRRKARLSVRYVHKKERLLLGFRERNGRYVADISHCPVLHPQIGKHMAALTQTLQSLAIRERIPQIECAVGDNRAAIVVRHLDPMRDQDARKLQIFQQDTGLHVLLQPGGTDSVHALDGTASGLEYGLEGYALRFEFDPLGFVQVNAAINKLLVRRALELLEPGPEDHILDLFCGLGNFSLPLARAGARVTGVEGAADLVDLARKNAVRNEIDTAVFHRADLSEVPLTGRWTRDQYDKILLDPPRTGAHTSLPWLRQSGAGRVLYVSCDPATLARDSGVLVHELGFALRGCGVVDMFPHTAHVESIALFELRR